MPQAIERFKTRHFPYLSPWQVSWLLGETNRRMKGEKLPPLRHLSLSNSFLSHLACGKTTTKKGKNISVQIITVVKSTFFRAITHFSASGRLFCRSLFSTFCCCAVLPLWWWISPAFPSDASGIKKSGGKRRVVVRERKVKNVSPLSPPPRSPLPKSKKRCFLLLCNADSHTYLVGWEVRISSDHNIREYPYVCPKLCSLLFQTLFWPPAICVCMTRRTRFPPEKLWAAFFTTDVGPFTSESPFNITRA